MSSISKALKAGMRIEYCYIEVCDEDERYQATLTMPLNGFHLHITAETWDELLDEVNDYCARWNNSGDHCDG